MNQYNFSPFYLILFEEHIRKGDIVGQTILSKMEKNYIDSLD
jgi:hypothetical protein